MIRIATLTIFLTHVLLIGLPFGPLELYSYRVQETFEPLGFDVSMTPITSDMTMMRDPTDSVSLYRTKPKIVLNTGKENKTLRGGKLELYPFKLPLILYLELYAEGAIVE